MYKGGFGFIISWIHEMKKFISIMIFRRRMK